MIFKVSGLIISLLIALVFMNEAQTLEGNTNFHWLASTLGAACFFHYAKQIIEDMGI